MALFKILSNMGSNEPGSLPLKVTQGYCYFDVRDGKWWVDIAGNGSQNAVSYIDDQLNFNRMPLNAYKADKADLATLAAAAEKDGTGENTITNFYAHSLDLSGRILSLKNANNQIIAYSGITLGALAVVDAVSGTYTPAGSISAGNVTITPDTEPVSKLSAQGTLPTLSTSVTNEVLSFTFGQGAMPTFESVIVWKGYSSATVGTQTFSGTPATITLSPVTGGAQNGDNVYF